MSLMFFLSENLSAEVRTSRMWVRLVMVWLYPLCIPLSDRSFSMSGCLSL